MSLASRSRLVIIDDNRMRQAGIVSLMSDWAGQRGLAIVQINISSVLKEFEHSGMCRLVLFSVGGGSIESGEASGLIRVLPALAPDAPVIVISDREEPAEILCAYRASCSGYIPTSMEPFVALQAMEFILGGGSYFPPSALDLAIPRVSSNGGGAVSDEGGEETKRSPRATDEDDKAGRENSGLVNGIAQCDDSGSTGLTDRQREVLNCLKQGQPNKVIARELGLTEGTVKVHVRQIMRKLGVANRTQVAILSAPSGRSVIHVRASGRALGFQ